MAQARRDSGIVRNLGAETHGTLAGASPRAAFPPSAHPTRLDVDRRLAREQLVLRDSREATGPLFQLGTRKHIGDFDARFEPPGRDFSTVSDLARDQSRGCFDVDHYARIDAVR